MARPTSYTPELCDRICALLAEGSSLRKICLADDMPSTVTVFKWLREHEGFLKQYARARDEQAEHFADELIEIADNSEGDPQRDRLRVDTRKWVASKLKPKKYGDATKIEHSGSAPFQLHVPTADELRAKIRGIEPETPQEKMVANSERLREQIRKGE